MILRMVRGRVLPGRHEPLRAGLVTSFYPSVRAIPDILRFHVALGGSPDGDGVAFITCWISPDAAMAVLGRDVEHVGVMAGVSEHLAIQGVDHYEVEESLVADARAGPAVARIAVGAVELGNDVEIQHEVRQQLATAGDEVVEAHVGRRIRGRMVEVASVTLWRERPAGLPLEEPMPADLADRYASFSIEVYPEVDPA